MRKSIIVTVAIILVSCVRSLEPTPNNINKIFASKDFTFEFHKKNGTCESLSFRNDYLVYKSANPTIRREITYDEVLLINDFIQKIVNKHSTVLDPEHNSYYVIKNTAYKVLIVPKQEEFYFEALIKTLKLNK
ncbi:hypothetical protein U6A24_17130 [Aquimarina gracilis]|uniref:Lipoprotein n=1 Tax=Aquimarina gracilis TaxID=874422 RepID=A0ABU5ZZB6_9FLAO|nr:hypothetical protein [Aquimarina gracilis]MEB3347201.1 hypothetical protein [Aquimarina gracilis]